MQRLPDISTVYTLYERYNSLYFAGRLPPAAQVTIAYSNRLTASAGICYPKQHSIRLSTHYHRKFPGEVSATLLHEMIHLLVPRHGAAFKAWVVKIRDLGGKVELHARERATFSPARWLYVCSDCGQKYERRKRLQQGGKRHACGKCRGKLEEEYRIQESGARMKNRGYDNRIQDSEFRIQKKNKR